MNGMIEVNLINGIVFGIEWMPKGVVCDDEGYVCLDIGIIRFLFTYM